MKYLLLLSILPLSTLALAEEQHGGSQHDGHHSPLKHNYVEAGYLTTGDSDLEGFELLGSFAINHNWHVIASYEELSGSKDSEASTDGAHHVGGFVDEDEEQWQIGIGYSHPVGTHSEFVNRLYIGDRNITETPPPEAHADPHSIDERLYVFESGWRSAPASWFEYSLLLSYTEAEEEGGSLGASLASQFKLNDRVGLYIEITHVDSDNKFFLGPRFSF